QTWTRFDHGVKADRTMMAVALHPRDPDQVYCVSRSGQVFGTEDGGRTWREDRGPDGQDGYALGCAGGRRRWATRCAWGSTRPGGDATKAACRAAFDAIHHSSLPLARQIRERGGKMLVDVTVGVPDPASVDVERVRKEFPHGEVTVHAVSGGLKVPGGDGIIA